MYLYQLKPVLAVRTSHGWLPSENVPSAFYSLRAAQRSGESITALLVDGRPLTERSLRTLNAFLRFHGIDFNPHVMPWAEFAEWIDLHVMSPLDAAHYQDCFVWTDAPAWLREIRGVESPPKLQSNIPA